MEHIGGSYSPVDVNHLSNCTDALGKVIQGHLR